MIPRPWSGRALAPFPTAGAAVTLAAAVLLASCTDGPVEPATATSPAPATEAPIASEPVVVPPASITMVEPSDLDEPLAAGTVEVADGAFSQETSLADLALVPGDPPRVTGTFDNVVDVSAVLALELSADFYDDAGRYLATGSYQLDEEGWEAAGAAEGARVPFDIPAAVPAPGAAAAVVRVVQLVNE